MCDSPRKPWVIYAASWGAAGLDTSARSPERHKPLLLPATRRCRHWERATVYYCNQQGDGSPGGQATRYWDPRSLSFRPQEGGHRPERDPSLMWLTAPHLAAGPGMLRDHILHRQHHWKTVSLLLYQPQPLSVLREDSTTSFGFLILLPSSPSESDLHLLHLFLVSSANPSPMTPCPLAPLLTFLPAFMEIARDPRSQRSCLPPCLPHPVPLSLSEDHCCSPSPFLPFLPTLVSRKQRRGLGESPQAPLSEAG